MEFRHPTSEDYDKIIHLSYQLQKDVYPCRFWELTTNDIDYLMNSPSEELYILADSSEIIGIGTITYMDSECELSIAISNQYRNMGYGKQITSMLLQTAKQRNCTKGFVEVWEPNAYSHKLVKSMGFRNDNNNKVTREIHGFGKVDHLIYTRDFA